MNTTTVINSALNITFWIIYQIIFYAFGNVGTYVIAKRKNIKNSQVALIPFLNTYMNCKLVLKNDITSILFSAIYIAITVFSFMNTVLNFQLNGLYFSNSAVVCIIFIIICYKIYKMLSDKYIIMTIFSVLTCGALIPFFLFAIRNNKFRDEQNSM